MSGKAFSQSVSTILGPPSGPRIVETYGTRGASAGWSRFQRSLSSASRRRSGNEGAEKTSAAIPNFSARSPWAERTRFRVGPEPTSRTRWAFRPTSYTHLRAHETRHELVCRLLLEKKKK